MRIYVDGDACPVKELIERITLKLDVKATVIASINHVSNKDTALEYIYVDGANQSVDMAIMNRVCKNDIVITDDYGLASLLLMKEAFCLSSKGMIYNQNNIDDLLYTRHLNASIMKGGGRIKGPVKRDNFDNEKFLVSFHKVIQLALHSNNVK